jgi:hypothetical protein
MKKYQPLTIALVAMLFIGTVRADEPKNEGQITVLKEKLLQKKDWKNAGFKTPQATLQTFLWATREGSVETVLKCFDTSEELHFTDDDKTRMKEAANVATGYQPLAIRSIAPNRPELKFKVTGWQDKPLVHRFKLVDGKWKIDSTSSTTTADW